jgi:hypothetical protein
MHFIQRRVSPALIIAIVALFLALAGTAAATVIINSPDQIADRVVTSTKLATNAVTSSTIKNGSILQQDQVHPTLRARVRSDGQVLTGDTLKSEHVKGSGRYDLTMDTQFTLGKTNLQSCAITATPQFDVKQNLDHKLMRAYAIADPNANKVTVFAFEQIFDGREVPADADISVVAAC